MTAEVIEFPNKHKQINVDYPYQIAGTPVDKPKTRHDYLSLCKRFLDINLYEVILCAISDKDYYDLLEDKHKRLVDSYYGFHS